MRQAISRTTWAQYRKAFLTPRSIIHQMYHIHPHKVTVTRVRKLKEGSWWTPYVYKFANMELLSEDSFEQRAKSTHRERRCETSKTCCSSTSFNLFSLFRNRVTVCGVCTAFRKSYVNPVVNKISGFYVILLLRARICNETGGYVKPHLSKNNIMLFPSQKRKYFFFHGITQQPKDACVSCVCVYTLLYFHACVCVPRPFWSHNNSITNHLVLIEPVLGSMSNTQQ